MAESSPIRPLRCLLFLLLLAAATGLKAQGVDNVYIYGTVKDYTNSKKLDGITVQVFKNGAKLAEVVTNASGKYEFNLDYGSEYKIVYAKTGIVSKNIVIDTRNVPEEERVGGHGMDIEMTLFSELPGIDFSILQQPIGKAKFSGAADNGFSWDMDYTQQVQSELSRLMKEYEDKRKREANADADYAKLMSQGEAAMTGADYKKAVESFTGALALKANDPKATARLSDAKMKLDELEGDKKKAEQYAQLIKDADALFGKKDYTGAKSKYEAASDVKEEEAYPKQKIKECDTLIAEAAKKAEEEKKAKELEEKYKAAIAAGDAAFKGEKYEDAKAKFTEATGLKPAEQYPKDQLAAIAKKLDELAKKADDEKKQKELDAKYQAAIVAADAAFNAANYDQAKAKYNEALGLKAEEKYPKDQLAAIDKKLEELAKKADDEKKAKELEEQYKAAIAAADAAFNSANYDEAKAKYNAALALKATEKYPKDQLAAIDKKLEELAKRSEDEKKQKELDEKYKAALAAADGAFQGQKWDDAKAKYTEALGLKPAEKYPKDQLAAIDKAIADAAKRSEEEKKQKELDAKFTALVEEAEKLFNAEKYSESRGKFQEALGVKPDENHPKERIVEIDAKLAELARKAEEEKKQKELDAKYTALIASADKGFDDNKLAQSLNDYKDASTLKPAEQYPKDRIAAIQQRMDADAQAKAEADRLEREKQDKEKRYNDLIAQADKAFTAKQYESAKSGYTDALGVKPDEQHPKDRLAEIQRLLDEAAAQAEADRLKAEQDASERDRLEAERKRKEAEAAELEARYRDAVAAGDIAFSQEQFDAARTKYTDALTIKPDEQYPKDRIAAIEQLLADRAKAQTDAERAAEEQRRLDEERRRKEAADAEAARLAAEEERNRMEGAKAKEERYHKVIADADAAFAAKSYPEARDLYTQALDIKPDETYPPSRIEQIDKLLAEEERLRREAELAAASKKNEPVAEKPRKQNTSVDIRKEQEAEQFMREARAREEAEKYDRIKKLKSDVSEEDASNASEAGTRREEAVRVNKAYEAGEGGFQGTDAMRKKNEEELAAFRAQLQERNQQVDVKAFEVRGQMHQEMESALSAHEERVTSMETKHTERVEASVQEKKDTEERLAQSAQGNGDRTAQNRDEAVRTAENLAAMSERGNALSQGHRDLMVTEKQRLQDRDQQLLNNSQDTRMTAKEQLDKTQVNQPRDFADYYRSKLAMEYPQGVTEESYTEGNKVIIRRIVVQGNKADDYSKVIAKWGTFYFKNGQSISEQIWSRDTEE